MLIIYRFELEYVFFIFPYNMTCLASQKNRNVSCDWVFLFSSIASNFLHYTLSHNSMHCIRIKTLDNLIIMIIIFSFLFVRHSFCLSSSVNGSSLYHPIDYYKRHFVCLTSQHVNNAFFLSPILKICDTLIMLTMQINSHLQCFFLPQSLCDQISYSW